VFGHGDGEAEAASLEGAGGVGSLFLDEEAGIALAVEEGSPAFAQSNGGYVGEDAGVAPHAEAGGRSGGAGGDFITLRGFLEKVHVVADVEGASAQRADGLWGFRGDVMVTSGTLEGSNGGHILDATGIRAEEIVKRQSHNAVKKVLPIVLQ